MADSQRLQERYDLFRGSFLDEHGREPYRGELQKEDPALYMALHQNEMLGLVPTKKRRWTDAQVVRNEFARFSASYEEENGPLSRSRLLERDAGLYQAMNNFNLLDELLPLKKKLNAEERLLKEYSEKWSHLPWNDFYCDDEGFKLHKRLRKYGLVQKARELCGE